jgi:hypothetical protein
MIDGLAGNWKSFQRFQSLRMNLEIRYTAVLQYQTLAE